MKNWLTKAFFLVFLSLLLSVNGFAYKWNGLELGSATYEGVIDKYGTPYETILFNDNYFNIAYPSEKVKSKKGEKEVAHTFYDNYTQPVALYPYYVVVFRFHRLPNLNWILYSISVMLKENIPQKVIREEYGKPARKWRDTAFKLKEGFILDKYSYAVVEYSSPSTDNASNLAVLGITYQYSTAPYLDLQQEE